MILVLRLLNRMLFFTENNSFDKLKSITIKYHYDLKNLENTRNFKESVRNCKLLIFARITIHE